MYVGARVGGDFKEKSSKRAPAIEVKNYLASAWSRCGHPGV